MALSAIVAVYGYWKRKNVASLTLSLELSSTETPADTVNRKSTRMGH